MIDGADKTRKRSDIDERDRFASYIDISNLRMTSLWPLKSP